MGKPIRDVPRNFISRDVSYVSVMKSTESILLSPYPRAKTRTAAELPCQQPMLRAFSLFKARGASYTWIQHYPGTSFCNTWKIPSYAIMNLKHSKTVYVNDVFLATEFFSFQTIENLVKHLH